MKKTDLKQLANECGFRLGTISSILYTPKFHCDLAGYLQRDTIDAVPYIGRG